VTLSPEEVAALLLKEFKRRVQWKGAVLAAGFERGKDEWIQAQLVTDAVAKILGERPTSTAFRREIRQYLLAAGWQERRVAGVRQWEARRVKRQAR
jgi:hypothetical protein